MVKNTSIEFQTKNFVLDIILSILFLVASDEVGWSCHRVSGLRKIASRSATFSYSSKRVVSRGVDAYTRETKVTTNEAKESRLTASVWMWSNISTNVTVVSTHTYVYACECIKLSEFFLRKNLRVFISWNAVSTKEGMRENVSRWRHVRDCCIMNIP